MPILRPKATTPGLENRGGPTKGQLLGAAVFRKDRMVGELSPEETETLLLLSGRINHFIEVIPVPGDSRQVAVDLTAGDRQIAVDPRGTVPRLSVRMRLEGELREMQMSDIQLTDELLAQLEQAITASLERKAGNLVRRLQTEFRADSVGFGNHARLRFLDWPTWTRYNWPERFPNATLQVAFQSTIRRVGMTFDRAGPR